VVFPENHSGVNAVLLSSLWLNHLISYITDRPSCLPRWNRRSNWPVC